MAESYDFLEDLKKKPFLVIIGKFDHILGPHPLYFSSVLTNQGFIERVLRDALHTNSKYVNLDFDQLYAQGDKIEVDDASARGKKQLYVVVLLREASLPPIPPIYFKHIEMLFMKLGKETILSDNPEVFEAFSTALNEIYLEKREILPLEFLNHQVRSGVNTIQGFCELIQEGRNNGCINEQDVDLYIDMMLDSCNEIIKALDEHFS